MLSFSFAPADSVPPINEAKDIRRVALEFQTQQKRTPSLRPATTSECSGMSKFQPPRTQSIAVGKRRAAQFVHFL